MDKLFYVPIEPLEERYTEQWYTEFPKEFSKLYDVTTIDGEALSDTVDVGTFLDINSTIFYKNSQMQKIAKLFRNKQVPNGSIFFFGDAEYWGLESLRLMADMNGIKIKIFSFLHAASYIQEDAFQIAQDYQKYTELGWIMVCDKVFVGTEHHKNVIIRERINPLAKESDKQILKDKIVVTGNPLFKHVYHKLDTTKEHKLVLPNRFDKEKRPEVSLEIAKVLKKEDPSLEIVVCTGRSTFKSNSQELVDKALDYEAKGIIIIKAGLTKEEYHKELASAKVTLSTNTVEETFGYCVVEALEYEAIPICPNSLSHPELLEFNNDLLYEDFNDCLNKIRKALKSNKSYKSYNDKYYKSLDRIIKEFQD